MSVSRLRFESALEWGVAAAFLAATLAVSVLILQGLHPSSVRAAAAPAEPPVVTALPTPVPENAVSVPVLPFGGGKEIRLGETATAVTSTLGRAVTVAPERVDRGRLGPRLTRFYQYAGFRLIVVYEPFERNGEPRVTAIYLP